MKHFQGFDSSEIRDLQGCSVAFGFFDGVHAGHRKVLESLLSAGGNASAVISLHGGDGSFIYTEEEKEFLLSGLGLDAMISFPAPRFHEMGLQAFMREYVLGALHPSRIVAGEGYHRLCELAALCNEAGVELVTVPDVLDEGDRVTPELIKKAGASDFDRFIRLLGAPYIVQGPVVHGRAAGGKHGMPTANISFHEARWLPAHGVYAMLVYIDGRPYRSVTNIGPRPSVDENPAVTIEAFLLDFQGDLYGKTLRLEAYLYERGIIKFQGGFQELRQQIDRDIIRAEECLSRVL